MSDGTLLVLSVYGILIMGFLASISWKLKEIIDLLSEDETGWDN